MQFKSMMRMTHNTVFSESADMLPPLKWSAFSVYLSSALLALVNLSLQLSDPYMSCVMHCMAFTQWVYSAHYNALYPHCTLSWDPTVNC